ncbi:MAG: hypothetical protein BWK75_03995 [Candidatus Altiarchaeales archaeon A3]|nr:MAG: hypothetical protein BWK75_03995 [Candidatus Altiarchaeales archaeon A3]
MEGNSGIGEIIGRIENEARAKAGEIENSSAKKVNLIMQHFERLADDNAEKIRKQGEDEISLIKRQIISNAEIGAKDKIDKEKFIWVENAFEEARQTILNLNAQEKKDILERMCDIPDKENFVFCVDKKYINLLGNVDNVKEDNINDFGVIIKSKDGRVTIDNTITNRLNILKQNRRYDVAKILFG